MKIIKLNGKSEWMKMRADLSRLATGFTGKFIDYGTVSGFLTGRTSLDYTTSKIIFQADKSIQYIERFVASKIKIKNADHIIALLCIYSEDSLGLRILGDEFSDYIEELQDILDQCQEHNYNGVLCAEDVMDFIISSNFLEGKPSDVCLLLFNLFLAKEGVCLVLDDTDAAGVDLVMQLKYKVSSYAKTIHV